MKIEPNNIYLGDAYELIKHMEDNSVDLIITDPPYKIDGLRGNGKDHGILSGRNRGTYEQEMVDSNLGKGIDLKILDDFVRVMKKINIYIWCNKEQIYDYMTYFVKERKCNFEMLIWAKENVPPFTNGHYLKDKEYCLYFWEKGVKLYTKFERARTYFISKTNTADKKQYKHPTIKPIELIELMIQNSTSTGGA